ncbi:hypothetical protein H0H93_012205 [Arthromyces matolae]|nr:hypothetical protein H0H93_012205 [Arthromyces matolae]
MPFYGPGATILLLALIASATPLPPTTSSIIIDQGTDFKSSVSAHYGGIPDGASSGIATRDDHDIALASRSEEPSDIFTLFAREFDSANLLSIAGVPENPTVQTYKNLIKDYSQRQKGSKDTSATILALREALALLYLNKKQILPYREVLSQIQIVRDTRRSKPDIKKYAKEICTRLSEALKKRRSEGLVVKEVCLPPGFKFQYMADDAWASDSFDPAKLPQKVEIYLKNTNKVNAQTLVDLAAVYEAISLKGDPEGLNITLSWQLWTMAARMLIGHGGGYEVNVNAIIVRIRKAQRMLSPAPVKRLEMMIDYLEDEQVRIAAESSN